MQYDLAAYSMYGQNTRSTVASKPFVLAAPAGPVDETRGPHTLATIWTVDFALVKKHKGSAKSNPFADDDMGAEERAPVPSVAAVALARSASTSGPSTLDRDTTPEVDNVAPADTTGIDLLALILGRTSSNYDITKMKDFDVDDAWFYGGGNVEPEYSRDLCTPSPSSDGSAFLSSASSAWWTTPGGYDSDTTNTSIDTDDDRDIKVVGSDDVIVGESSSPTSSPILSPVDVLASVPAPFVEFENKAAIDAPEYIQHEGKFGGPNPPSSPTALLVAPAAAPPAPRVNFENKTALDILKEVQHRSKFGGGLLSTHEKSLEAKVPQPDTEQETQAAIEFGEEAMDALELDLHVGVQIAMTLLDEVDREFDDFE